MSTSAAERTYRKGLKALAEGEPVTGMALFEAAIRMEQRRGVAPAARYLSFYGWCLALVTGRLREAESTCRRAVEAEFYNPDLYLNLGRVLLLQRDRARAHRVFLQGLRLQGNHPGLTAEVRRMGLRRRPVVPFLSRRNPMNRLLGRITAR